MPNTPLFNEQDTPKDKASDEVQDDASDDLVIPETGAIAETSENPDETWIVYVNSDGNRERVTSAQYKELGI